MTEIRLIPLQQRPGQQPPADITIRLYKNGDTYECHGSSALLVYANTNVEIQEANGRYTVTFPAKNADILFPRLVKKGYKIAIQ